jgi:hypothetical protein
VVNQRVWKSSKVTQHQASQEVVISAVLFLVPIVAFELAGEVIAL